MEVEKDTPNAGTDNQTPGNSPDKIKPVDDPRHGDSSSWNEQHCENSECLYPKGHEGPCSHQEVRSRFRPQPRRLYAGCAIDDCVFCRGHDGPCVDDSGRAIGEFMDVCGACESVDDPGGLRVVYDDCSDESVAFPVVDDPVEPKKFEEAARGPMVTP